MRTVYLAILFAVSFGVAGTGFADHEMASGSKKMEPVGKVQRIYIREDGDLFIQVSSRKKASEQELWADVRFAELLTNGRDTEFVRLPDEGTVRQGDLVEAKVIEYNELDPSPIAPESHVTKIVAKRDSVAAMAFELKLLAKTHDLKRVALLTQFDR